MTFPSRKRAGDHQASPLLYGSHLPAFSYQRVPWFSAMLATSPMLPLEQIAAQDQVTQLRAQYAAIVGGLSPIDAQAPQAAVLNLAHAGQAASCRLATSGLALDQGW